MKNTITTKFSDIFFFTFVLVTTSGDIIHTEYMMRFNMIQGDYVSTHKPVP